MQLVYRTIGQTRILVTRPWLAWAVILATACDGSDPRFEVMISGLPEALLSVGGTAATDVWVAGADRGRGPLVVHFDGATWARRETGTSGDLWWVHALAGGPVFFGGANATVLRYQNGQFQRLHTPGVARDTVYGVWGASADDIWAVGSVSGGRSGFVWRFDGHAWRVVPLPPDVPRDARGEVPGLFKVTGDAAGNVWIVGGRGLLVRYTGGVGTLIATGTTDTLFTVASAGEDVVAVGGGTAGVILEGRAGTVAPATSEGAPLLQGVSLAADGKGVASGEGGSLFDRSSSGWRRVDTDLGVDIQSLHAVWLDPDGGAWAVGGNVLSTTLDRGVLLHRGPVAATAGLAALIPDIPVPGPAVCPADAIDPRPSGSIARRWDEQMLNAIRRDVPRPVVHARNLYHVSAAFWDAWAAYDPVAAGVFVREKLSSADVARDRAEAMSYAAYRVLVHRYQYAAGGAVSKACFTAFLAQLGYDPDDQTTTGDSPRALGNRIGQAIIDANAGDGANEAENYADPDHYQSPNDPLVVDDPGTTLVEPSVWQPLNVASAVTQNGIPTMGGVQGYIGAHWGNVRPFAMVRPAGGGPYHDVGGAPTFGADIVPHVVDVIRKSAALDPSQLETIDISPGNYGNNPLGSNAGTGHALNPTTGLPYAPQVVRVADFARTLAEFWADGPKSETPPGHWNVIANLVTDMPGFERRLFGGEPINPLEWDVKVYLALNGAVHDAGISAWEIKRIYVTVRPISLVRYMAGRGQRSDQGGPSYDPEGLPLVPGLIEVITAESSAPGERHQELFPYIGEIAVVSWRGEPGDRAHEVGGCTWIRGREWIPYQLRTFVTPAFPGYISGHSTFSRSAAEVLAALTGSETFPGGLAEFVATPTYLTFEQGPSTEVRLQWATYFDASDQAGQSRLWGGIHIQPDDFDGRRIGHDIGLAAVARAREFYDGTATTRAPATSRARR